jgi:transcriptional regulator with XRE-family HTH domain
MNLEKIGATIKNFRKEKGWRQDELAEHSGVPMSTITKIEAGFIKNPSIEKMAKIAKALGITVDELINAKETI